MPDGQIDDQFRFRDWRHGYYGVLFFYPLNFTLCVLQSLLRSIIGLLHHRTESAGRRHIDRFSIQSQRI